MRVSLSMPRWICLLVIGTLAASVHAEPPSLSPIQTLSPLASDIVAPPGFEPDVRFGYAVAVRGDIALVGLPYTNSLTGKVAVFSRGSDRVWQRSGTLVGTSPDTFFGWTIAFRENIAAIGSGSEVHLFKFLNTAQQWKLLRRLVPAVGELRSVDYQDGRLVVGGTGAARVYQIDSAGKVLRNSLLKSSTGSSQQRFGFDIALAGDTVVVGAPDNMPSDPMVPPGPGAAYVFKLINGQWIERQKLFAADGQESDGFGFSVAIDKGMIIVGAPGYQQQGQPFSPPSDTPVAGGAGFVYTQQAGVWRLHTKIRPTATQDPFYSAFGLHIAMFDSKVVVTAARPIPVVTPDDRFQGLAFAYNRTGSDLQLYAVARPESGLRFAGHGQPVSISNFTLFAGSPLSQCNIGCIGHAITFDLRQTSP